MIRAIAEIVKFARTCFGAVGEGLILYSPIWLSAIPSIYVMWELANYRIQKLRKEQ